MSEDTNKQGTAALRECIRCYRKGEWSKQVPEWTVTQEQAERELASLVAAPALPVRDTLEMAAKAADIAFGGMPGGHQSRVVGQKIAEVIRALAPAEDIRAGEAHDAAIKLQALIDASLFMPCGHLRTQLSRIRVGQGEGTGTEYCIGCAHDAAIRDEARLEEANRWFFMMDEKRCVENIEDCQQCTRLGELEAAVRSASVKPVAQASEDNK